MGGNYGFVVQVNAKVGAGPVEVGIVELATAEESEGRLPSVPVTAVEMLGLVAVLPPLGVAMLGRVPVGPVPPEGLVGRGHA